MMNVLVAQRGYEVETAQTVADALEMAKASRFNLYVIDNHFPDGTGIELCRQIRTFNRDTPIIIYSGTSTGIEKKEVLQAGAQDYLLKPHIEELLQSIDAFLK
jgi:DNA-binding response OmpR family regulator